MKRTLIFIILLIVSLYIFAQDIYVNGSNDIKFIYKTRQDSLNTYFEDEFGFNFVYDKFTFGMKYIARMPKYDDFVDNQYLTAGDISYGWEERFISFESDNFYVLGGLFSENFGSGVVLSSVYDKDFGIDTRITGSQIRVTPRDWTIKGIYGAIKNEANKNNDDLVYGIDLQRTISSFIVGASGLAYRQRHSADTKFSKFNIFSGRLSYGSDIFETDIEVSKIKEDSRLSQLVTTKDGTAIYGTTNIYLNKFMISGGYKKYEDFDIYINDPPRLNHSDEPLSENVKTGKDEEGFLGEVRFDPNDNNSVTLNYSEAWNKDKTIKLSDFYAKADHKFTDDTITFEISNTERYEEPIKEWTKETTPVLSYDTMFDKVALHFKTQYKIKKKVHSDDETTEYEPFLQTDFAYNDKSLSFIFVYPYKSSTDFLKNKLWIGMEAKTFIYENTDITLFVGKEKGGKVCRNGVCKYQSRFSGVRLNISTKF